MPMTSDEQVSFNEAWTEIESNLNSDPSHDVAYLIDRTHAWYQSDEPIRNNMIRACWRQMLSILTTIADGNLKSSDSEILDVFQENYELISKTFEEAEANIKNGRISETLSQAGKAISQIEEFTRKGLFIDNDKFVYRSFMSPLEGMVWRAHTKDERDIVPCPFPFDLAYLYHAIAACKLGNYEDAETDLHKALHWNPANSRLWFELGENYRHLGQTDEFGQCLYSAYPYAINAHSLARYHRDCGYFFVDNENLEMAAAHLHVSIALDAANSAKAWQEMGRIIEHYGKNYMMMNGNEAAKMLNSKSEPILGDPTSIGALVGLLNQALAMNDLKTALAASSSLYEMTNDDNMHNVLMTIMMAMNNNQQIVVSEN